jgi:hypothetical protein
VLKTGRMNTVTYSAATLLFPVNSGMFMKLKCDTKTLAAMPTYEQNMMNSSIFREGVNEWSE